MIVETSTHCQLSVCCRTFIQAITFVSYKSWCPTRNLVSQPYDWGRRHRDAALAPLQGYGSGQKLFDTAFHMLGERHDRQTMCELQIPVARDSVKSPRTNAGSWRPVRVLQIDAASRIRFLLMNRLARRKRRASGSEGERSSLRIQGES